MTRDQFEEQLSQLPDLRGIQYIRTFLPDNQSYTQITILRQDLKPKTFSLKEFSHEDILKHYKTSFSDIMIEQFLKQIVKIPKLDYINLRVVRSGNKAIFTNITVAHDGMYKVYSAPDVLYKVIHEHFPKWRIND